MVAQANGLSLTSETEARAWGMPEADILGSLLTVGYPLLLLEIELGSQPAKLKAMLPGELVIRLREDLVIP